MEPPSVEGGVKLERLSAMQKQIVLGHPQNRAVYAGPGSGKTSTLTHHIIAQLRSGSIRPEGLLVLTYTKQAALELRHRLEMEGALTPREVATIRIGTFHGSVFRMLLQTGVSVQPLLTPLEHIRLLASVLRRTHEKQPLQSIDSLFARCLSEWPPSIHSRSISKLMKLYQESKERAGRWDFDDVFHTFCQTVSKGDFQWAKVPRIDYVLVDEFQDTNAIQMNILERIGQQFSAPLFVVGDEDQSIYGFRGANPSWLLNFPSSFENVAVHTLAENFRSDRSIVDHATTLIQRNRDRSEKVPLVMSQEEGEVHCLNWRDEFSESRAVVQRIIQVHHPDRTIAVLARTRSQLHNIALRLSSPYRQCTAFHTLHDAKGKEWDEVHIVGAVQKNPYMPGRGKSICEEERRLFYVGMTRCRHKLFIHSPRRIEGRSMDVIQFVSESGLRSEQGNANFSTSRCFP